MENKKKSCDCVRECPCFPGCDEMMEQNQIPGGMPPVSGGGIPQDWWRGATGGQMPYRTAPWMQSRIQPDVETENEQDWEKMKELYPEMAKLILGKVEDMCDRMEYEGSPMFDMVPDKSRVKNITGEIQKMLEQQMENEPMEEIPDLYTMNQESCRNCRPNQNFLGDFIETMLYQEMHRRRCRHRRFRRW